jgi:LysM repeat protein
MMKPLPYFGLIFSLLVVVGNTAAQTPDPKLTAQQYIARYKDIAIAEMMRSNVPASITLAQGMLESSLGNSPLAVQANNHFGVKCKGWAGESYYMWDDDPQQSCFRKYRSPEDSYLDHSDFLVTGARYKNCFLQGKDYRAWAVELKKAGYATNPKYAELLIERVEKYQLYRFDTMTLAPLAGDPLGIDQGVEFNDNPEARNRKQKRLFDTYQKGIFEKNGLRFAIVKKGEDPLSFAARFGIPYAKFLKYNEMSEGDLFFDFQFAFFQPKRFNYRGEEEFHVVQENENLYVISQFYGVRLEALRKLNRLPENADPLPGDTIQLKKPVEKPLRYKPAMPRPQRGTAAPANGQGSVQPRPAAPDVAPREYAAAIPGTSSPIGQVAGPAAFPKEYGQLPAPKPKPTPAPTNTGAYTNSSPQQGTYGEVPFWESAAPPPPPVEQIAAAPATAPASPAAQPQRETPAAGLARQHTVAKGETLFALSRKYGIGVQVIKNANRLQTDALVEGQVLRIP